MQQVNKKKSMEHRLEKEQVNSFFENSISVYIDCIKELTVMVIDNEFIQSAKYKLNKQNSVPS